ncbi:MAG: hypothetical protein WC043_08655 [Pseudobdellovibrionaceae bacterium]
MLKLNKTNRLGAYASASVITGVMAGAQDANATTGFQTILDNITDQISDLPGFITAIAYIIGVLFAVLGILKIKDHVENPSQTPLREGVIRLAVGGMLFTLPLILQAMQDLLDNGAAGANVDVDRVKVINIDDFNDIN